MTMPERKSPPPPETGNGPEISAKRSTGDSTTPGPLLSKWLLMMRAARDQRLVGSDLRVLPAVLDRMGESLTAWPGYGRIAADTGLSRRTVTRSVERLASFRYIEKHARGKCVSNLYRIGNLSTEVTIDTHDTSDTDDHELSVPVTPPIGLDDTPLSVWMTPEFVSLNLNQEPEEKNQSQPRAREVDLPEWLSADLWAEFEDHRRQLKAKLTPKARSLIICKLGKLRDAGHDPQAVIEQSIENGWKGVFEIRSGSAKKPDHGNLPRDTEAEAQMVNAEAARRAEGWL